MILLKSQRLLSRKEGKDTNQCDIIVTVHTSDNGSIPFWWIMIIKIAAPKLLFVDFVYLSLPIPIYHYLLDQL